MVASAKFFFHDGTYYSLAGPYDMERLMEIKGEAQELSGRKIVGHTVTFLTLAEFERKFWTVRPIPESWQSGRL